jgi:type II secretory pathway component PulJ
MTSHPRTITLTRRGMTLVEMLVATTCTLILMGAIAQVFGAFGNAVSDSRSMIELDNRLRTVSWRLRNDLSGATARTLPPLEVEAGEGYLEIIEGPRNDARDRSGASLLVADLVGDIDDVLLFTTRNTETPYLGRYDNDPFNPSVTKTMESQLAEVSWFLRPTPGVNGVPTYTLFRRQLLVAGYIGFAPFYGDDYPNAVVFNAAVGYPANPSGHLPANNYSAFSSWGGFFDCFDLSVKRTDVRLPVVFLLPNTLADLTRRENRFMHNNAGFVDAPVDAFLPFAPGLAEPTFVFPDATAYQATTPPDGLVFTGAGLHPRIGEDVILTNVLSFDIRVFDPAAPVKVQNDVAVVPIDPGFDAAGVVVANGAYVDLGWGGGPVSATLAGSPHAPRFADLGDPRSGLRPPTRAAGACTFDTWSTHYESNGFNDDVVLGDTITDQAADGLDNDTRDSSGAVVSANGFIDDRAEMETLPPYSAALRGIEIRLRCYEPSSRQVRQVTIRHSFVPR